MRVAVNAHLSFGLVTVPVGVSPSSSRQKESFKQLHAGCEAPIKQEKTCSKCGAEHLSDTDLVKGVEVVKGEYVTFSDAELESLLPERSPQIELKQFIDSLEPLPQATASYWLVPKDAFIQPYVVLRDAMIETGLVGLGSCCLWGKEHLCVVGSDYEGMKFHLLNDPRSAVVCDFKLPEAPSDAVALATSLLQGMSKGRVQIDNLLPDRSAARAEMVQAKMTGKTFTPVVEPKPETTVDLMAALKESIAEMTPSKAPRKKKLAA